MISIVGVDIHEKFFESDRTVVYRGTMIDGRRVIVKSVEGKALSKSRVAVLCHEWRMLSLMDSPFIPSAFDFQHVEDKFAALIMDDIGAEGSLESLDVRGFDLVWRLNLAINVAAALDAMLQSGITHYDVKPENIIWSPERGAQLIDLGLALSVDGESVLGGGHREVVGTLPYMSPEQTGGTNHQVDHRSDLYSLGVVLYRLLSGELPFQTDEIPALIHAHIAIEPEPLHERLESIPRVLSDIVARLLEKEQGRRYQSAAGLVHDLSVVRDGLASHRSIKAFDLGQQDYSSRFQLSETLYSRNREVEMLKSALENVRLDSYAALALVKGKAESGKTSLVGSLYEDVRIAGGVMVRGVFERRRREIENSGLFLALEELIQDLLMQSEEDLVSIKEEILLGLGDDAEFLIEALPSLGLLIGSQKSAVAPQNIAKIHRLKRAVEALMRAVVGEVPLLVCFLDNLECIDPGSLLIFQHLLLCEDLSNLVLIGAYREEEVEEGSPLTSALAQRFALAGDPLLVEVGGLQLEDVQSFLSDSLNAPVGATFDLAEVVLEKTEGIVGEVHRLMKALRQEDLFRFNHQTVSAHEHPRDCVREG